MRPIVILLLLAGCASQPPSAPKPRPQAFDGIPQRSVAITESALIAPRPLYLTWDAPPDITEWKVYTGANRNNWTTNWIVTTNRVPYVEGKSYGVSALGYGEESALAYWPSNKVVAFDVEVADNLTGQFVGIFTWMTWTNVPDKGQPSKYLRLKERLVRWE